MEVNIKVDWTEEQKRDDVDGVGGEEYGNHTQKSFF